jgi:anti-sigma factor RsiW
MNCRSAESLFSSYIEDEISQEERRALESHFMGCRRCSLSMRQVRATMSMLSGLPEVAPSAHFDEEVYARIRSGEGLRPSAAEVIRELFLPARWRPAFVAGAGACAVLLTVMVSPVGHVWMHASDTTQKPSVAKRGEPVAISQETKATQSEPSVAAPTAAARASGAGIASHGGRGGRDA